ncbi:adenylate/guanylate cyclase domain-containing protein [Acinetobacter nectaris]|uniref:adenylate/guanylate cyclase domain-containing protein n=1 Tax=Acinetobacter nectaris TaxID=1219382 RepID=UPI001F334369|nr:adenylate/guanylate cyclase domain-containing protein [Acinetobacter nectaris]MCF9033759.1 adenylate/guanylate cyclase domain-containing protein [Acinetobacter nectaris]
MSFDRIINNRFIIESLYRLMAYLLLSLGVLLYYFSAPLQLQHLIVAILSIIVFPLSLKLFLYVKYEFNEFYARQALFILDSIIIATALAATHFSIVFSTLILTTLCCVKSLTKISFFTYSFAFIIALVIIYLNAIIFFGFENYFALDSLRLVIYSLICFLLYLGSGFYFNKQYLHYLENTKDYYQEQMNRYVQFSTQLSRYAPNQLWQSIMSGQTQAKIEYKRKKMTVFFSDIQGFTELSEKLIPDDLAFVLNDYLSHMTEIAKKYEATLDKFIGDGVLIFFGDPHSNGIDQDAKNCIDMAISMRQQMHVLRERWLKMGFPELHVRMGVSTGYCHVGNYGSDYRMSYTVIGHDVNLASRLQGVADIDEILIADSTYNLIKDEFICIPKQSIKLKGLQNSTDTWQVLDKYTGIKSETQKWFDYEYKGFHLLLNLEEVQHYEYDNLVTVLEKAITRIEQQKSITTESGVARLRLEDQMVEIVDIHKKPPY